jgi:hypothetical protein
LPVWLYSYQQVKGDKKLLHYVAVNARTKETMGSVPIHAPKLLLFSFLVEVFGGYLMAILDFDYRWVFLASGFVFYGVMYARYRNNDARHKYEEETKTVVTDLRKVDTFVESRKGLTNAKIVGANNHSVSGQSADTDGSKNNMGNKAIDMLAGNSSVAGFLKDKINK